MSGHNKNFGSGCPTPNFLTAPYNNTVVFDRNIMGLLKKKTHTVPGVIPRHYHVTFLNCNTDSGPSSGIATYATLKVID